MMKDELHQLYPHIWCTSYDTVTKLIFKFKELNIHQVINVSSEDHEPSTKRLFKEVGIKYVWLKTYENARVDICKRGVQVAKLIKEFQEQDKATLIHCFAAINRTISCILVAKMVDGEVAGNLKDVLAHIQSIRSIADPMPEFMKRMLKFQAKLDENRMLGDCSLFI